jgi:hypothetical protein
MKTLSLFSLLITSTAFASVYSDYSTECLNYAYEKELSFKEILQAQFPYQKAFSNAFSICRDQTDPKCLKVVESNLHALGSRLRDREKWNSANSVCRSFSGKPVNGQCLTEYLTNEKEKVKFNQMHLHYKRRALYKMLANGKEKCQKSVFAPVKTFPEYIKSNGKCVAKLVSLGMQVDYEAKIAIEVANQYCKTRISLQCVSYVFDWSQQRILPFRSQKRYYSNRKNYNYDQLNFQRSLHVCSQVAPEVDFETLKY